MFGLIPWLAPRETPGTMTKFDFGPARLRALSAELWNGESQMEPGFKLQQSLLPFWGKTARSIINHDNRTAFQFTKRFRDLLDDNGSKGAIAILRRELRFITWLMSELKSSICTSDGVYFHVASHSKSRITNCLYLLIWGGEYNFSEGKSIWWPLKK